MWFQSAKDIPYLEWNRELSAHPSTYTPLFLSLNTKLNNSLAYGTRRQEGVFSKFICILNLFLQFLTLSRIALRSILITSSHLRLRLPIGIFRIDLPVKSLKTLLRSSIFDKLPAHLNFLDLIILTISVSVANSLWSFLHSQLSSFLDLKIHHPYI